MDEDIADPVKGVQYQKSVPMLWTLSEEPYSQQYFEFAGEVLADKDANKF